MRNHQRIAAAFGMLVLLAALSIHAEEAPVRIYYYDRMPFFGAVGTPEEGFILKIARLVFEDAGIPYVFEKVPVRRIFDSMQAPGRRCVAGTFRNPERESLYSFSAFPIYRDGKPHYVFRKEDVSSFAGVTTIGALLSTDRLLGVVQDYSYGAWIDQAIKRYGPRKLVVNIGDDQNRFFLMLAAKRFDYAFAGLEEASFLLSSDASFGKAFSVGRLEDAPAGNERWLMFTKDFPKDLLGRIDASIPRVLAGPRYRAIVDGVSKAPDLAD